MCSENGNKLHFVVVFKGLSYGDRNYFRNLNEFAVPKNSESKISLLVCKQIMDKR